MHITHIQLFQTTKIQTFESNSQQSFDFYNKGFGCFRLQRYKLLKAIHNPPVVFHVALQLFQTTKIQTFESNSQRLLLSGIVTVCCFRLQRYKLLKAIHNLTNDGGASSNVVSDYKDTNF